MERRTRWIGVAVSVTTLDAVVVTYYGGVVWKAFAAIIWSKLLLFLLAVVWATTLLHIWTYACSHLRRATREGRAAVSTPINGLSAELTEEIDV